MGRLTKKDVVTALYNVIDPEIGLDIVSLGFIYGIDVDKDDNVKVTITLTTPGCPLNVPIQEQIVQYVKQIGANEVMVDVVWDPPWTPYMMSDEARKRLLGE